MSGLAVMQVFAGMGGTISVSAGVVVIVGVIFDSELLAVAAMGVGISTACGAGISIYIGKEEGGRPPG